MPVEPAASEIYEQLCTQGNNKFIVALKRVRGACDALVTASTTLSYAQVGKMAVQLYGGPRTQSILNNPRHKAYIDARRREQLENKPRPSDSAITLTREKYPSDALDYKTRRYIDDLRQRNNLLELAMRELKIQVLSATEVRPLDISQMISAGPKNDVSMEFKKSPPEPRVEVKRIIKQLLDDLVHKVPGLESYMGKGIRLRTGEWLLPPDQFAVLKSASEK